MFSNVKYSFLRVVLVALAGLTLSACASRMPENIRADDAAALLPFTQAINTEEQGVGQLARWGGVVAEVTNTETTSTIEVVQMALKGSGRPVVNEQSAGRFRIRVNGFVDPDVFTAGRSVTVYGTYVGKETDKIGEFVYDFPVIESKGVHLWRVQDETQQVDVMMYYGFGSPYYRHPFYMPGTIRVRHQDSGSKSNSGAQDNRPRPMSSSREELRSSQRALKQE
ncbi:starvation-inducible protein [Aliidiomarina taiwanensis]|uniref:Starvation-inducible protein n=1 Tax=Aliidiomarina taiwanensis TaxID=946228 RepID=A0A432X1Y7_9GAMM|nr:Slp family lipoprotein [Aliidiomarina taiwanensis]RUO40576.1 starvation-inducible protein [Aliidiomarina taiwanensis]